MTEALARLFRSLVEKGVPACRRWGVVFPLYPFSNTVHGADFKEEHFLTFYFAGSACTHAAGINHRADIDSPPILHHFTINIGFGIGTFFTVKTLNGAFTDCCTRRAGHAKDGMVNAFNNNKSCGHPGCNKYRTHGVEGSKTTEFCAGHAKEGMVNVVNNKKCVHPGCLKQPRTAQRVAVVSKRCTHPGCLKQPSSGVEGSKTKEFCAEHEKQGVVSVVNNKKCVHPGCNKQSSYGVEGRKMTEFCAGHAKEGMVDVTRKGCGHPGCNKYPPYGMEGSKTAKFCAGHTKEGMHGERHQQKVRPPWLQQVPVLWRGR